MGSSSALAQTGLGLSIFAFVFDIIGFPSPYWISVGENNSGLFHECGGGTCAESFSSVVPDWFQAVRALNIIGFLLGVGCMIVGLRYVAVGSILGLAAGICIVIGSAVYGAKIAEAAGATAESFEKLTDTLDKLTDTLDKLTDILGWSFALTAIGGVLYLAAGVVFLCEKCMVG